MNRTNGWDERDYKLWSQIQSLPSYGLVAGSSDNPMLARKDIVRLLEEAAEKRFADEWITEKAAQEDGAYVAAGRPTVAGQGR